MSSNYQHFDIYIYMLICQRSPVNNIALVHMVDRCHQLSHERSGLPLIKSTFPAQMFHKFTYRNRNGQSWDEKDERIWNIDCLVVCKVLMKTKVANLANRNFATSIVLAYTLMNPWTDLQYPFRSSVYSCLLPAVLSIQPNSNMFIDTSKVSQCVLFLSAINCRYEVIIYSRKCIIVWLMFIL